MATTHTNPQPAIEAMMGQIRGYDLAGLITYIADKKEANKFLADFQTEVSRYQKLVAAQADISQVESLLAAAKSDRENAGRELAQAQQEAARLKRESSGAIKQQIAEAEAAADAAQKREAEAKRVLDKANATARRIVAEAEAEREAAVKDREDAARTKEKMFHMKQNLLRKTERAKELIEAIG